MSRSSKDLAGVGRTQSEAEQAAPSVVDFSQRGEESSATPVPEHRFDLEEVLKAVRETAYRWNFASDRVDWAENASEVLGISDPLQFAKGRAFALLVDPEHAGARYDGITGGPHVAPGTEIKYCLHYRFLPEGRRGRTALWVEDTGICYVDEESRPRLAQGTLRVIDDRREKHERLLYLGSHDELTGQLNRTRLTEELTRLLSSAGRAPAKGAFLLAGVNDLTLINETYGFDVGDEVITIVGRRLGRALRGKDCIGRFSSNKFGIVLHDCDAAGLEAIAARLMATIRESVIDTTVGAVATSISIGAVILPEHAGNAQSAIGRCLQALDSARNNRGEHFALYRPCERRESERRRAVGIADEIVRALNDRRMMLALQPIVTSRSHEPELYECLLRMKRLDGSIASASEFIHIAEQFGLAKLIDHRVLELTIELMRSIPKIKLALNVSAATATDAQWLSSLEAFTGKERALTERLTIEITETAAISDLAETVKFDTSFRSLRLLGVDMVKIDGSFIENVASHAEDEMFVRTLIDLARNYGIVTVGEWVGDERTAKLLERAGVSYMQGYFFGAPELAKDEVADKNAAKSV